MSTVAERIKRFNSNRIPFYTAMKYELMSKDPFGFFRGTCHLFYEDLHRSVKIPASPLVWICGDLHLENFGSYKADNRLVYFDINDFDEGLLAPAAWELVRIVTSIFIGLDDVGTQQEITAVAKLFLQRYASILKSGKARYIEQQTATGITHVFLDKVCARNPKEEIEKRTVNKDGRVCLDHDNKKLFAIKEKELKDDLVRHVNNWVQGCELLHHEYKAVDAAFRVAGTGSLGMARYLFLLKKADTEKYLLIDMKQARQSSLQPFVGQRQPGWSSEAERIIAIQQRMQNIPPALLGTTVFSNDPYVLKEMQPTDDKIKFTIIRDDAKDAGSIVDDMALLTSSAQLRSSGRQGSARADDLIAFGENTDWQTAIIDYAIFYAGQVKKDYAIFYKDYDAGFFS
ncbi:MAG: DUF2252 family protein [Ferruginibacter sp.]